MKTLRFIDLFAGIGAFHIAMKRLGHKCVFASELSGELRELYWINHGMKCEGDITKISINEIPEHDILCAGFPCQSFSKAGNQNGMQEARGKLFDEILKILSYHRPNYFILENVRNLVTHDSGRTWSYISGKLKDLGYYFDKRILSPHHVNIPQHRERIFIVGSLNPDDITYMEWIEQETYTSSFEDILSPCEHISPLEPEKIDVLNVWQNFISELPEEVNPYRPLWSMEFGATYPVDVKWEDLNLKNWQQYKGAYGFPLSKCKNIDEINSNLPNYVKSQKGIPPKWKQNYILGNRQFYNDNKGFIKDKTLRRIERFDQESWKKFEWNCQGELRSFSDKLIQFRGSGVRIKRNNYIPSLVTVSTQIPVVGKYMRYIIPEEGARAQSLPMDIQLPDSKTGSFRVLGNMVNVELVLRIAKSLLSNSVQNNNYCDSQILENEVLSQT